MPLLQIERLQNHVDQRLGLLDMPARKRYRLSGGTLSPDTKRLADKVLDAYDSQHAHKLLNESRMLTDAGGGTLSNSAMPAAFERTVIREALYNMTAVQFANVAPAEFSDSLYIPYSYRKQTAAGASDARAYEGQGIKRASVVQEGETAYPIPQKLSFEVSDELRYLTSGNESLNWEVVAENQANATRIIGEDTDRLVFNELVQASDEYQTSAINNENLAPQVADGKRVVLIGGSTVTTICRPRKTTDLQGNVIGNVLNPVTVTYNGAVILEFDPSAVDMQGNSTLPAGNYYVLDYDIGEIWIVDKDGDMLNPAGKTWAISYSKASNVGYFDTDVPSGVKAKEHWDSFLRLYGLRKSLIEDSRYYQANFGLMSGNAMNDIEQAEKFQSNNQVLGTDFEVDGSLGRIKSVPNYKTVSPGSWVGDRRVIIGERGVTRLRITKPWTMSGGLENKRDQNGRFTGMKEAYGDQFIVLHTPKFLKAALTSMVLYSASHRVARISP